MIYLSKLPRLEKKSRVALDWMLDLCFSKDFASLSPARTTTAALRPKWWLKRWSPRLPSRC